MFSLPVMATTEAPIALATSKQTSPIGPGSVGEQHNGVRYSF